MPRSRFAAMHCSVARTAAVIGDPWILLILRDLFLGMERFTDIQRDLGIATNVLAHRLDDLVGEGIVRRERYTDHPPRDSYGLTSAGTELYGVVLTLLAWGDQHRGSAGAPLRLRHRSCGADTTPVVVCSECGEALSAEAVDMRPGPDGRNAPGTALVGLVGDVHR